jgi:hypothetical protein
VQAVPVPNLCLDCEMPFGGRQVDLFEGATRNLTASKRRGSLRTEGRWFERVKAAKRPEGVALTRLNQLITIEIGFWVSNMITKSLPKPLSFAG